MMLNVPLKVSDLPDYWTNVEFQCASELYAGKAPSSLTTDTFLVSITRTVINPAMIMSSLT